MLAHPSVKIRFISIAIQTKNLYLFRYYSAGKKTATKEYNLGANTNSLDVEIPDRARAIFTFITTRGACRIHMESGLVDLLNMVSLLISDSKVSRVEKVTFKSPSGSSVEVDVEEEDDDSATDDDASSDGKD